jgi:hypothetical protein
MIFKPGVTFAHPRFIQGSPKAGTARPDICTITRIARGVLYYRTESGMAMKTTPEALEALIEAGIIKDTSNG